MNAKEKERRSFTVPAASGSYAFERITFGNKVTLGMPEDGFMGVTVAVEGAGIASSTIELWLPRLDDGTKHPSTFVDSDYTFSGKSIAVTGAETWALAGYPGAQIRVKSGGTGGSVTIGASAF